jgi:microcystin-dependent protein
MLFYILNYFKINIKRQEIKFSLLLHSNSFFRSSMWALSFFLLTTFSASAAEVSQSFTYQGRFYNSSGNAPLSDVVNLVLGVYDPSGNCLLYEETQGNIDLTATNGLFAVQVGSTTSASQRSSSDPGLTMAQVFANPSTQVRATAANCLGGYTPAAGDSRVLRVTVTPHSTLVPSTLVPDLIIGAQASSIVAQSLQGLASTDFIQAAAGVAGQAGVSLASLTTLTGGSSTDASSLHNHDSLYVKLSGGGTSSNLGSGIAYTTGNIGIGTAVPTADIGLGGTLPRTIQVERNSVVGSAGNNLILLAGGATSGGTDLLGGNLILSSGTATGAGSSGIQFNTASAGVAGSTDRTPSTKMTLTADGRLGLGTQTPGAQIEIDASGSAVKGQIIKGAATQSSNLLEFQDSTGSILSYFDATGNLTLPGDPTSALQPATKQYVTGLITAGTVASFNSRTGAVTLSSSDVSTALGFTPVNQAGDTLTGALILAADPTTALGAATQQYVTGLLAGKQSTGNYLSALTGDVTATGPGSVAATVATVGGSTAANIHSAELSANSATDVNTANKIVARDSVGNFSAGTITADVVGNVTGAASSNVLKAGDSMTGLLVLSANPSDVLGAATKQYVDTGLSGKQATLGFTPANRAGDTFTGNITLTTTTTLGLGSYTDGQETILTGTLLPADIGRTWYNSSGNSIKYWNGTLAKTLGVSGVGITTLNGLTGVSQTFANGATGNAPLFNSSGSVHTLNIPLASSAGSVTAGLISNADYLVFNSKQASGNYITSLTGDVTASGSGSATATVSSVGGSTAANLHTAELAANAATAINTGSKIVIRDPAGNFAAGTVTAALIGNVAGNVTGNVSGNVTGNLTGAVTGAAADNVLKAGDSMTGLLYLSSAPTQPFGAVTKKYVDDINASLNSAITGTTSSLTLTFTPPLVNTSGTVSMPVATSSVNGYLASGDWAAFNGKVNRAGDTVSGLLKLTAAGTSLTTTGNVGIGTATPGYTLDVAGSGRFTSSLNQFPMMLSSTNSSGQSNVLFISSNSTSSITEFALGTAQSNNNAAEFQFNSTAGTGSASNYLGLGVWGNASKLVVTGSGNVGIGTTSPSTALQVVGTVTATAFSGSVTGASSFNVLKAGDTMTGALVLPSNGLVAGTNQLVISSSNVGIGTAAPEALLDVRGTIRLGINASQGDIVFGDYGSGLKYNGIYRGLAGSTAAGNVLNVAGFDGISFDVGQNVFGNAGQPTRMFITNGGNVGIGTTTPGDRLTVTGGGLQVMSPALQSSSGLGLSFETYGGRIQSFNTLPLAINPLGNNVGIGTTNPGYTLDVSGTGRFTGAVTASAFTGNVTGNVTGTAANVTGLVAVANGGTGVTSKVGTGSVVLSDSPSVTGTWNFPASGAGISWGSGPYSRIYDSGDLHIFTDDTMHFDNTAKTDIMTFTAVGNVGIGTAGAVQLLDVRGNISQGDYTQNLGSRRIGVMDGAGTPVHTGGMEIENTTLGGNYSQKVHFITHHYGAGYGRRMTINEDGNVGIGTTVPGTALQVNGTITATNLVVGTTTNAFIPTGGIIMWSGSIASIPTGWAICDGTNGTPNLKDRFVIGAGNTYAVAATGGSATTTLSASNMPAHTHTGSGSTGSMSANASHNHGIQVDTSGGYVPSGSTGAVTVALSYATNNSFSDRGPGSTGGSTFISSANTDHTHTYSFTTSSAGSGSAFNTLPPYYALAYIMKL